MKDSILSNQIGFKKYKKMEFHFGKMDLGMKYCFTSKVGLPVKIKSVKKMVGHQL
jgi:hypothetical protein